VCLPSAEIGSDSAAAQRKVSRLKTPQDTSHLAEASDAFCYHRTVSEIFQPAVTRQARDDGPEVGAASGDAVRSNGLAEPNEIVGWVRQHHPHGSVLWIHESAIGSDPLITGLPAEGVILTEAPLDAMARVALGTPGDGDSPTFDVVVVGEQINSRDDWRRLVAVICELARTALIPDAGEDLDPWVATLFAARGFFSQQEVGGAGDGAGAETPCPEGMQLYRDCRLPALGRPRGGILRDALTTALDQLEEVIGQRDGATERFEAAVAEHDRLAERFNALGHDHQELARDHQELARDHQELAREAQRLNELVKKQSDDLARLELRRKAEAEAAAQMEMRFATVARDLEGARLKANAATTELEALQQTKVMRYSRRMRSVYGRLRRFGASAGGPKVSSDDGTLAADGSYDLWIELFDTMDDERRQAITERIAGLDEQPLVSVILPAYNTPADFLRRAIGSVQRQLYGNWELCAVDDASTDPSVGRVLEELAASDQRVRVVRRSENGHIVAASNTALEMARGTWVVPLDHDDELAEHALAVAVLAAADHPTTVLVYSDEDKIDQHGKRCVPFFRPDFDPLRLLGQNCLSHMTMLRRAAVESVGGYREGTEGSQDWDLVLRLSEAARPDQIVHVPHVLYHWRAHQSSTAANLSSKPYALRAGGKVVADHLRRRGLAADTITNAATGLVRVKWRLPETVPKVSILIPTRDGVYFQRCIESILRGTGYADYEIVVIDNGSTSPEMLNYLRRHESWLRVVRDEREFNFSRLVNMGVEHCNGELICLLNDDCEVVHYDWLEEMVGQVLQDGVGAVGAKLLYGDGRIQHAGIVLGLGGVAGHPHKYADRLSPGYFNDLRIPHSASGVTAACMLVRHDAFVSVGGFDEVNLPIAFNDVDFCLRLGEAGWRIVWTPFAELLHLESVSRGSEEGPRAAGFAREIRYMLDRWGDTLRCDPYYSPNLSMELHGFDLAFPPRVP